VVQIKLCYGKFSVVVYAFDEDEMLRRFYEEEEEDKWLIQNEFVDNFSFKISSPPAHRICGFNLFTRFSVTSGYSRYDPFYIEIKNNSSGRSMRFHMPSLRVTSVVFVNSNRYSTGNYGSVVLHLIMVMT
jgi:hypothetical protein